MTIRNRLTLFIFLISAFSSLIAGGIVFLNASSSLEEQKRESLKALETSFRFLFNGFIEHNRTLSLSMATNRDLIDYLEDSHSIMTFVSRKAALEELNNFEEEKTIANAFVIKNGEVVLGDNRFGVTEDDSFILKGSGDSALYILKTPISNGGYLLSLIDLEPFVGNRLREIRINEKTHFFILEPKSHSFLIHTEDEVLRYTREEVKSRQDIIDEFFKKDINTYLFNGIKRISYTAIEDGLIFGISIPLSTYNFSVKSLLQLFISTIIILICIMVLVSFFASHYVIKPLRDMAGAVKSISEKKYDYKIPVKSKDEVGVVSEAINSMADEIHNYTENLEKLILDRTEQLQEAMVQLERISITDELTGLYNRRYFNEGLTRELARINRSHSIFSIIFFDLDNFKVVNDTYGHKVGDEVLITTARVLKDTIRETDLAARWGGEEFILLLSNTDINGAFKLAETLRIKLSGMEHRGVGIVTGSFGCTQWIPGDEPENLLVRCDKALYISKGKGRNCTTSITK